MNPFDPAYDGPWKPTVYYVEAATLFDAAPVDTLNLDGIVVLEKSDALPLGTDFISAGTVALAIEDNRRSRESRDHSQVYDPVQLLRVSHRGLSFTLELSGGLMECRYPDGSEEQAYFPTASSELTDDEKTKVERESSLYRTTRRGDKKPTILRRKDDPVPDSSEDAPKKGLFRKHDYLSFWSHLTWREETQGEFEQRLHVLPGTLPEILSQLACLFDTWQKLQASGRRHIRDEWQAPQERKRAELT
jgi:hypothetical protein